MTVENVNLQQNFGHHWRVSSVQGNTSRGLMSTVSLWLLLVVLRKS